MSDAWLVIGLGNPGPDYAGHRHNVGEMVISAMARDYGATLAVDKKNNARVAKTLLRPGTVSADGSPSPSIVLACPMTYMNNSGGPTSSLAKYYNVPAERVIVVHDELDIDLGQIRVKHGGGEGGHNGLRDITKALGTKEYLRVRCGIGRPPGRQTAADYVLRPFSRSDITERDLLIADAADAIKSLIVSGLICTQNRFHAS